MPTITTSRLPPPTSWDEFEEICKSAFSLRWLNPNLIRHGRQGQKQDGVDIYGVDSLQNFVGIQCKNTIGSIDQNIINSECLKAEGFTPKLTALYIATTADRDVNIQAYARQLSGKRIGVSKFPVEVIFWQDIIHDLSRDNFVIKQHYPQYFSQESPSPDQLKRSNDVLNITSLLEVIDFKIILEHLSWGAKYIDYSVIEHFDRIRFVVGSAVFFINDLVLKESTNKLTGFWSNLVALVRRAPYDLNGNQDALIFITPGDFCRNKEESDLFDQIDLAIGELRQAIEFFCVLINTSYPEVSLEKTSAKARLHYQQI